MKAIIAILILSAAIIGCGSEEPYTEADAWADAVADSNEVPGSRPSDYYDRNRGW